MRDGDAYIRLRGFGVVTRLLAVGAALLAVALAGGCGDEDDGKDGRVPDGAVAVVGDRTVSEEAVDSQVETLRRAQTSSGGARPGRKQLEQQALAVLLQREWLEQEGERRGVEVDEADVRERWRAAVRNQFPTRKALRRFLHGQTEADVIEQLQLQALSEAIERDIRANAKGNPRKAVKRFRKQFERRRQQATDCRKGYTALGCETP